MTRTSNTASVILMIAGLCASVNAFPNANAFLKIASHLKEESISKEDVQTSLLSEVEAAFGEGTASSRTEQLKKELSSIYDSLPKNEKGLAGHASVRYALHRLFVQRHGWVIRGLDAAGGHRNSTSSAGLLKDQVPEYLQELFEKRLGSHGFGLHELAVVAATIEHLIHNEAIKRVGFAFKAYDLLPTSLVNESVADDVLDTYMAAYILGEDLSKMTIDDARKLKAEVAEVYVEWDETKQFVRRVRHEVLRSERSEEEKASEDLDFSIVARVAERLSEKFGGFQHKGCEQMKGKLVKIEEKGTGRVRLSDFYKPALDGQWQFQESVSYLRQLGALDEMDPIRPRVIIVNYINSPANYIASSNFYSIGCMDECEGLLGQLERQFRAPEALPDRIAKRVSMLSSSSVAVPRALPSALLKRLEDIAAEHGGSVPLHGRLFAQWMHHAFPLECPYPHVSGTTNPLTSDEWLNATGEETEASNEEMAAHVEKADILKSSSAQVLEEEIGELPWDTEEELLVMRQPLTQKAGWNILLTDARNVVLFMVVVSIAYGLVQQSKSGPGKKKGARGLGPEKIMV